MRRLGGGGVGVARHPGRHFQRDPAVAAGALCHRGEQVAGVTDVGGGDRPQRLPHADRADGHRVHLVVVGVRAADRRGEDGRIRGDADDGVLVDQGLQIPTADAVA